jgi:adenosylcobinamide-phosphate synthase
VELLGGVALDLALGDPRWLPHPVRAFGWLVARLERLWRASRLPLRIAGVCFWLTAVGGAVLVVALAMRYIPRPWIAIYWIFALLAIRDLDVEAARVIAALRRKDVADARRLLSFIVGRDTAALDEPEILRATIETVAENLCDGVIAPLFYLALGGPMAMAGYKAINTLDSMVGYRNERYREFGWASARMDDIANWIPARLSALLIWIAAIAAGCDPRSSVKVTMRDARTQPSPNAGYPEAAVAGALGIRLGGLNYYQGVASRKPYLGDARRALDLTVYRKARVLLYGSSLLMVALTAGLIVAADKTEELAELEPTPPQRAGETACPTTRTPQAPGNFPPVCRARWGRRFRLPEFCKYLKTVRPTRGAVR